MVSFRPEWNQARGIQFLRAFSFRGFSFRSTVGHAAGALLAMVGTVVCLSGCATGDSKRLKSAREHFVGFQAEQAESELVSPKVLEHQESRLQHYLWLASVSAAQDHCEKAIFYLDRARTLALELRSDRGGFDWLSTEYKGNPLEFSQIHYLLVVCDLVLAEQGKSPAWSIPEIRLKGGKVLFPKQEFPAREFTPREIAEFRTRARAELKAWDQFLTVLKRTYPGKPFFQDDLLMRVLGSFLNGNASTPEDRRVGELLGFEGQRVLESESSSIGSYQDQRPNLSELLDRLTERARAPHSNREWKLVLIETGVMPEYREKKVVVGLSTLFNGIEDQRLRFELERIGLRVLLEVAPEFGLVAFTGAVAGAATASEGDSPQSITGAIDRSFGFEMAFPSIGDPVKAEPSRLILTSAAGKITEVPLLPVSPVREILARELAERQKTEWAGKAVKIGIQYLSILVPAVIAYRDADRKGDWLKKLGILAGYFLAKKAIDRANAPDLRSWSLLPSGIAGQLLDVDAGIYSVELVTEGVGVGPKRISLGQWDLGPKGRTFIHKRVFDSRASGL